MLQVFVISHVFLAQFIGMTILLLNAPGNKTLDIRKTV